MATLINGYGNVISVGESVVTMEPAIDDIPTIYWDGIGGAAIPLTKAEGEIQGTVRYLSKTLDFSEYATIKVQGHGSATEPYKIKNYTMKFYEDADFLVKSGHKFRDFGKLKKVVLKKHFNDCSHIRNVGTARLWGQIVRSRSDFAALPEELRKAPNNSATNGFTVRVFANGVYMGLYELIVPKDKIFGQDDDNPYHSIMGVGASTDDGAFNNATPTLDNWEEELQDSMTEMAATSMKSLIAFVTTSTDEEFVEGIGNYLDIQSVIDMIIFLRLFCIVDNLNRNQIYFSYDSAFWYEGGWDFDCVLGLGPSLTGGMTDNPELVYPDGYKSYNNLYTRTETLFLTRCKERYAELRNGVLSVSNVISVFDEIAQTIANYDGLREEDWAETTAEGMGVYIPYTDTNNIQQIRDFVRKRWAYMDGVIEAM